MFNLSQTCSDTPFALWGLFDLSIAPTLLYYAYIPVMVISLFLGVLIFKSERYSLTGGLMFGISLVFTGLLLNEILQWVASPVALVLFGWELIPILRIQLVVLTIYFVSVFIHKKDLSIYQKLTLSFFYISVLILAPTTANVAFFDIDNCEGVPGWLFNYVHILEGLGAVWILFITARQLKKEGSATDEIKRNSILGFGAGLFLIIFFSLTIWGDITTDYGVAIAGSIGMLLFMISITFIIVKYKSFNIKLAGAQALVMGLVTLVGSQLFFVDNLTNRILVSATLFFTIIGGFFLVRSVKKEIKQREELELLTQALEKANVRLKELDKQKSEFVSIASHQLRSPLTAMRGYASMLVEGSFGKIPEKALEAAKRIEDSAKLMAMSVEDYLNVSRIESGNMKYNLSDFNVQEMTDKLCDDLRPEALKQNLILLFRSNITSRGVVNADVGKTNQIIHNLINNSIKYTPKGTVNVFVRDDVKKKRIYIDITDTGIGMSQATQHTLFQKFSRADNANSVNVSGTGLGLYVAFKMAEAMGGTITCKSEGDGKGSTFTFELPLGM